MGSVDREIFPSLTEWTTVGRCSPARPLHRVRLEPSVARSDSRQAVGHVASILDLTIILVMSDVLPLAEVKAKFSEMVDRVEQQHERITVTRNGRPAAVLMSAEELEALEDTLELLSDPSAMAGIEEARLEVRAGRVVSADELRARYLGE
jgi:prevent-host-death family protein